MLADIALEVAQMVVEQMQKRRAQMLVTDIPGRVVLPSLFYALDGTLLCNSGRASN